MISRLVLHLSAADVPVHDSLHLEEHWKVVDEGAGDHGKDGQPGTKSTPEALVARPANGRVAVRGHQDDRPHGHRVGDRRQRPDVWLQTRVGSADGFGQPVGVVVDGSERLD